MPRCLRSRECPAPFPVTPLRPFNENCGLRYERSDSVLRSLICTELDVPGAQPVGQLQLNWQQLELHKQQEAALKADQQYRNYLWEQSEQHSAVRNYGPQFCMLRSALLHEMSLMIVLRGGHGLGHIVSLRRRKRTPEASRTLARLAASKPTILCSAGLAPLLPTRRHPESRPALPCQQPTNSQPN